MIILKVDTDVTNGIFNAITPVNVVVGLVVLLFSNASRNSIEVSYTNSSHLQPWVYLVAHYQELSQ